MSTITDHYLGDGIRRNHRDARGRFRRETNAELKKRIGPFGLATRRLAAVVAKAIARSDPYANLLKAGKK